VAASAMLSVVPATTEAVAHKTTLLTPLSESFELFKSLAHSSLRPYLDISYLYLNPVRVNL
jgi:hypothetical protein